MVPSPFSAHAQRPLTHHPTRHLPDAPIRTLVHGGRLTLDMDVRRWCVVFILDSRYAD
ncbi:MAG: hypothetical protein L0I84_02210 [Halomonas subglaciescola]|nr:hypothetical protein [Halomonas subglaciescola]